MRALGDASRVRRGRWLRPTRGLPASCIPGAPGRHPFRRRTDGHNPWQGRGGPNQEYALALVANSTGPRGLPRSPAIPTEPMGGPVAPDDPAGAFVDGRSAAPARALGLDPALFLADNNSTGFFIRLGDLLRPGPTYTNVNDFRAILVDRP